MSSHFPKYSPVGRKKRLRVIGLIGWALALLLISALVITPLRAQADGSTVVTHLAELRVTPAWPQMGVLPPLTIR